MSWETFRKVSTWLVGTYKKVLDLKQKMLNYCSDIWLGESKIFNYMNFLKALTIELSKSSIVREFW